jgi:hypothetical protein
MYAEVFTTNDGYEVVKWRSEEDAENDSGEQAIDRYQACNRCAELLPALEVPEGDNLAVWVDEEGVESEDQVWVCDHCLEAGDPSGPGYRKV